MWIDMTDCSVCIEASGDRDDLYVCRFRSVADGNAFVDRVERFVFDGDIEQRRAMIFGRKPGQNDYRYEVMIRRTYVEAMLMDRLRSIDYENLRTRHGVENSVVAERSPSYHFREGMLMRKYDAEERYQKMMITDVEHHHKQANAKPVYTPKHIDEKPQVDKDFK